MELVYDKCGFKYTSPLAEKESAEYGAFDFKVNGLSVKFRVAKTTPTKIGQFVTLWKRLGAGPIQPYQKTDPLDLFVISARKGNHFGQFIFPKSILCERGIISCEGKEGQRALRVYPPWDKPTSQQAQKTQRWQLDFFLEIPANKTVDTDRTKMLYC